MSAALEARIIALERQVGALKKLAGPSSSFGRSTMVVNDTGPVQTVQSTLDVLSARDGIPVLYSYGFTSSPPVNADLHMVYRDNDPAKAVVIASGHQSYRMRGLQPGEAAIYDQWGNSIRLTGASIVISSSAAVQINAPALVVSGTVTSGVGATGTFTDSTGSTVTVEAGIITNINMFYKMVGDLGRDVRNALGQFHHHVNDGVFLLKLLALTVRQMGKCRVELRV